MSPKPRNEENNGLPRRWRYRHGAYYYRPKDHEKKSFDDKADFRLGRTLAEAHRTFAERLQWIGEVFRMDQLCDRYSLEIVPTKGIATQRSNTRSIVRIRKVFATNAVRDIEPVHIYRYRDTVSQKHGKKTANLDLEVLSHMFTKAIEWGARRDHPMTGKQVVKFSLPSRERYVEDWELESAMTVAPPLVELYVPVKLLLGCRKAEILSIKLTDLRDDGVHIQRKKRGKAVIYEWTPTLRQAVDNVIAARKKVVGLYLFSTRKGQPYIKADGNTSGFDSIWQRFMAKALGTNKVGQKNTKLEERFTEHDLRAKVGSEAENVARAQQLLGHASPTTTRRIYRRKPEKLLPAG